MSEEFDSLVQNLTWELQHLPAGQKSLSCKWVFKAKQEVNPVRVRLKARLIAQGLEQEYGIDYNKTFAPVVRWSTLRALIALRIALGWELHHMDVITTILNGKLKKQVYMQQPPGFEVPGVVGKIKYIVNKCI
jgi:hypothetical protein